MITDPKIKAFAPFQKTRAGLVDLMGVGDWGVLRLVALLTVGFLLKL